MTTTVAATAADILKVLRLGEATRAEVAVATGLVPDTASRWLREWERHGIVVSRPDGERGTGRLYWLAPAWRGPT